MYNIQRNVNIISFSRHYALETYHVDIFNYFFSISKILYIVFRIIPRLIIQRLFSSRILSIYAYK